MHPQNITATRGPPVNPNQHILIAKFLQPFSKHALVCPDHQLHVFHPRILYVSNIIELTWQTYVCTYLRDVFGFPNSAPRVAMKFQSPPNGSSRNRRWQSFIYNVCQISQSFSPVDFHCLLVPLSTFSFRLLAYFPLNSSHHNALEI